MPEASAGLALIRGAGAAMVFVGAGCAGSLAAAWVMGRGRARRRWRLIGFALLAAALIAGGALLTRPEARGVVGIFAFVPFVGALVLSVFDLRRSR
jgi:hypothetical protein